MKKKIEAPKFRSEDEERAYWSKMNLADYLEAQDLELVSFPNLKPSSRAISIRLSESMLVRLKELANELNIPYQALIKQYLEKGLQQDRPKKAA